MGTFAEYIGTMDVPENQRAEYAQQMLELLHAGGMMSVDEVGLFGHRIRLLYPPELDEAGRAWGCYNYFEGDFWESWGSQRRKRHVFLQQDRRRGVLYRGPRGVCDDGSLQPKLQHRHRGRLLCA